MSRGSVGRDDLGSLVNEGEKKQGYIKRLATGVADGGDLDVTLHGISDIR